MVDPYEGREQSQAKHFILKSYLQALAFKLLSSWDEIAYVDGFSGPWFSHTEDFSDTSFKIAIDVLTDAQARFKLRGQTKKIRCFFVEKDPVSYEQLTDAVTPYDEPDKQFLVRTYGGIFEDAVPDILDFIGKSFALVFIDPTGWTGYPYDKISPLLRHEPGEVLINFMYDFINRFAQSPDSTTEDSLAPILGGPGWRNRLDSTLPPGRAVEKLFRDELAKASGFQYVTSTRIDKSTVDRPHFFIVYGTRHEKGLVTFRQVEYDALRKYEVRRFTAKQTKREQRSGQPSLFAAGDLPQYNTLDAIIDGLKEEAKRLVLEMLEANGGTMPFSILRTLVLQAFMLRETNVKDICVELAIEGRIESSWKDRGKRKPTVADMIILKY